MKKLLKSEKGLKGLVLVLTVTMIALTGVTGAVFAEKSSNPNDGTTTNSKSANNDETVYVMTDANGSENQRIVSEAGTLHYEGYEDAEVPVTFDISYTLDGKAISPDELAGKSGHVVMTINYTNHIQSGDTYVPFMAITGMMLDDDYFSNIKVTNGKTIDDGNRNVVVGYAFPGMQSSIGVGYDVINIPSSVTVDADVEGFQIETIYSVVTNQVFQEMDLSSVNSLGDLKTQLSKLKGGVSDLLSGTTQLYEGTQTLVAGTNQLRTATDTLNQGTKDLLDGSVQLVDGTNLLTGGTDKLVTGAKDLSDNLTAVKGSVGSKSGIAYLNASATTVSSNSKAINTAIQQVVDTTFASANSQLGAAGVPTLTEANYKTVLEGVITEHPEMKETLEGVETQLDSIKSLKTSVATYTGGVDQIATGLTTADGYMTQLSAGAKDLSDGLITLRNSENDLVAGAKILNGGLEKMYSGTSLLNVKTGELDAGVKQLNVGAKQLSDGVQEMADQGLSKLAELEDSDLMGIFDNIQSIGNAGKAYTSFGEKGSYDSVKFIYKTEEIAPK